MLEEIRDWFALRRRRGDGGAYPTTPPEPKLTPEEEIQAREQRAGVEHEPGEQPREER